ncbi:hypothetical protein PIB30_084113 [Stylosanthes scabra]|uniref:PB1-like domain-containing protein n=1 Tax=Stylosanthes scabra TaxID=79078 RepID=A0ABU6RSC4_9FABA|nr:hypothetical protein [Stylosanthes scabra]
MGVMRYVGGEELTIADADTDFWSMFEADEQVRRLGDEDVAALWYKDPAIEDFSIGLRMLLNDKDALDMARIAEQRRNVELFVVHEDNPEEGFPEIGYIDVGGVLAREADDAPFEGGQNAKDGAEANLPNGQDEANIQNEEVVGEDAAPNDENGDGGAEEVVPLGENENENGNAGGAEVGPNVEEGAGNEDAAPHEEGQVAAEPNVVQNEEDVAGFTDSEEELDVDDNFFGGQTDAGKKGADQKGKGVVNEEFQDDGEDSDEIEGGYEVGGGDAEEGETLVFPVHRKLENMACYNWEPGTVYGTKDDFKDAVI